MSERTQVGQMISHHVRLDLESSKQDRTLYFELINYAFLQVICTLFCILLCFLHFEIHWNYFQIIAYNNITHEKT